MRRSFKVGFCLKNACDLILLTEPKFQFNASNGPGIIKKLFTWVSDPPQAPSYKIVYIVE